MNMSGIATSVSRGLSKVKVETMKHLPTILTVAGVAGLVVSVAEIASQDEGKETIVKASEELDKIEELEKNEETYTAELARKDKAIVVGQAGLKLVKCYGVWILMAAGSIVAIFSGHKMLLNRYSVMSAAYAAEKKRCDAIFDRIAEELGEEKALELKEAIRTDKTIVTDLETGEVAVENSIPEYSIYSRIFDESCMGWTKCAEDNLTFLLMQQRAANQKLREQGVLFLNEVYDGLGIPRTKAGQIVGWVFNEKNPVGDNQVDFGIYDPTNDRHNKFVNGYERNIVLDFNVDGNVYDML